MNQITSFADASNVYGSDVCEMRELRRFHGGLLNSTRLRRGKALLPQTAENAECKSEQVQSTLAPAPAHSRIAGPVF